MDIIYLHDLRIDTVIGVFDWERRVRQTVILDLDLAADIRRAAARGSRSSSPACPATIGRLASGQPHSIFKMEIHRKGKPWLYRIYR